MDRATLLVRRKELRDRDAINGQVCTAADYTVKVR